eukprot:gnl/TRDRNA2_/TRDRNA2_36082_c0_seq1.p1 gnl/TRDRNA2_/TRDRNA2_36082_c0~~gnl/TRDRNA2_/TRDRNA2_36082_c0_seq1.p1  ORF type:complete len:502 (-),score=72.39 gnl/TRDRNA2_/TRDRNA2_36082_c0_seq1:89-1594(-)
MRLKARLALAAQKAAAAAGTGQDSAPVPAKAAEAPAKERHQPSSVSREVPKSSTASCRSDLLRRYAMPQARAKRNMGLLKRQRALRPDVAKPCKRCAMCHCERRLGRTWKPPKGVVDGHGSIHEAGVPVWYCEPCWFRWLVINKQWFVDEPCGWVDLMKDGKPDKSVGLKKVEAGCQRSLHGKKSGAASGASVSDISTTASSEADSGSASPVSKTDRFSASKTDNERSRALGRPVGQEKGPMDDEAWLEQRALNRKAMAGDHFDFIEIGTSNYHTFTQTVAGHPDGKPYGWAYLRWTEEPQELRGLAVDMKQRYLDMLPDLPRVSKARAAVSDRDGFRRMYHVPLVDIERWERKFAARGNWRAFRNMRLARGCSALVRHNVLKRALQSVGLQHLIRVRRMRVESMATLLRRCQVRSIDVLALDCEGHDCAILKGLLRACRARPQWYPRWVLFETNGMNDEVFGQNTERRTMDAWRNKGYLVTYGGGFKDTKKRDTVLKRNW